MGDHQIAAEEIRSWLEENTPPEDSSTEEPEDPTKDER